MDKKITFFERLKRSILDFTFYRDVVLKESLSESIKFYFLFLLMLSLIFSLKYGFNARAETKIIEHEIRDFPKVMVKNGKIITQTKKPYMKVVKNIWLFIDPAASSRHVPRKYPIEILLTNNRIELNILGFFNSIDISKESFPVERGHISAALKIALLVSFPFVCFINYLMTLVIYFAKLFLFSLLSILINVILKAKHIYNTLLSIGIYAVVTSALISAALFFVSVVVPFKADKLLLAFLYVFYLYNAIKSTKQVAQS